MTARRAMTAWSPLVSALDGLIMKPSLLFHTVRHLKSKQIYGRVAARLRRQIVDRSPAPQLRQRMGPWVAPVERPASLLGRWHVRFLNEEGEIEQADQWNDARKSMLWRYNLHYFDDLATRSSPERAAMQRELIGRWILENPSGMGIGWEPYPLSLRIVNWIKWCLGGQQHEPHWIDSLAVQLRWLERNVEWHLLGNHVLANAKALVFAGMFFAGEEADRWRAQGLDIYWHELSEQILADGGHFELSPMYHAIILEDLLDLMNAARAYGQETEPVVKTLPTTISGMRKWLTAMTHPDGCPAFFNDASFDIAPTISDLEAYATRLGLEAVAKLPEGVHVLKSSGYACINCAEMTAILDMAPVGPDYIPGHAHADTLSFELSLGRERIVVNSGTSTYAVGPLRTAQRSTASHSTVEIGDLSSSEVWGSFRVARRARVFDVKICDQSEPCVISASHDGYHRLAGRPTHRRSWCFSRQSLIVRDEITGQGAHPALARFYFAAGIVARAQPSGLAGLLLTQSGRSIMWTVSSPARIQKGVWYPGFGKTIQNEVLAVPIDTGALETHFRWS